MFPRAYFLGLLGWAPVSAYSDNGSFGQVMEIPGRVRKATSVLLNLSARNSS